MYLNILGLLSVMMAEILCSRANIASTPLEVAELLGGTPVAHFRSLKA